MQSILIADLARMGRDGGAPLIGRPNVEPSVLEEVAFREKNGMSRADFAERERQRKREAAEDQILNFYRGPIPGDVVADVRGLRGARLEFARFKAWLSRTAGELAELESTRSKLNDIIEAPTKTAGGIAALVKRTASLLIGNSSADIDADERLNLDRRLAAERHRAEAARQALPEVEAQIAAKQMQAELLQSRESEFLNPLMQDLLEASGVAKLLARRRAEVARLELIIKDCDRDFPRSYYDDRPSHPEVCDISWHHSWRDIAGALRSDPRAEVGKLLPKA